jgi:alkaline phosphatase
MKLKFTTIYLIITLVAIPLIASTHIPADSLKVKPTKKAKNIILMIGDGMGTTQIYSGITANKGLNIEKFKDIGFSKTYSANKYITDSGAGGTAISTGVKTNNYYIGVDSSGNKLKTILEIAEDKGMETGLVSTSSITHATPASFIAHCSDRKKYENIASDFLKTDIDVFIGGGKDDFNKRSDGIDLVKELIKKGYQVTDTITEVVKIKNGKLAGFTSRNHNPSILDGRGEMLSLATNTAINILNSGQKGFFLMVEGSQIDWGGHDNDAARVAAEVIDFDKAVGIALDFAKRDGNTLVIVTADHETGGMSITEGNIKTGDFGAKFAVKDHTAVMVPVFAFGPGSENFKGIFENTAIFYKMLESLGIKK